jgi:DNA helicase-2/ATP-dependent DNA helicase PcrA
MTPNDQQLKVIQHVDGPCLVAAVPGSGKTASMTERIKNLVKIGKNPESILAITFTNKAADSMRKRISLAVGPASSKMTISTFHSLCARIIRANALLLGLSKSYTIYDDDDQERMLRKAIFKVEGEKFAPTPEYWDGLRAFIEGKRNNLLTDEEAGARYHVEGSQLKAAQEYLSSLKACNAIDFTGLLSEVVRLFEEHPEVLSYYTNRFQYVNVDEWQDTNIAQYRLVKLIASHRNVMVIGDVDQCIPSGVEINTDDGTKKIKDINEGDWVESIVGRNERGLGRVYKVSSKPYHGEIFTIRTAKGHVLKSTGNHVVYGSVTTLKGYSHVVYLMYKEGKGYRIGRTMATRKCSLRKEDIGLRVRMNQEHADKSWILKACKTKDEAALYEAYYSSKYGIPTVCFHSVGRDMLWTPKGLAKFWSMIETKTKADQLFQDMGLHPDYPFLSRSGDVGSGRICIQLIYFGNRNKHLVTLHGNDALRQKTPHLGWTRSKKAHWRVRRQFDRYDDALSCAHKMANDTGGFIVRRANFRGDSRHQEQFMEMQVSSLFNGMHIAVCDGPSIIADEVTSIAKEWYDGTVHDLGVEGSANFVVKNGVICHNSIYAFRGAMPENVLQFEKDFGPVTVLKLEKNYRSTPQILASSHTLITKNALRKDTSLVTDNPDGDVPTVRRCSEDREMALKIAMMVKDRLAEGVPPKEIAVFYRVNYASRVLEEAMRAMKVAYKVIGGQSFYARMEVKTSLAILKIISNPSDRASFHRVAEFCCRGVGEKTIGDVLDAAVNGKTVVDSAREYAAGDSRTGKALSVLVSSLDGMPKEPHAALLHVARTTAFWDKMKAESSVDNDRCENISELAEDVYRHVSAGGTLDGYLQNISLLSSSDEEGQDKQIKLMTMHACKGLEFDVVFISHANQKIVPHQRVLEIDSITERARQIEEERRLFYVAMTRARKRLTILWFERRRLRLGRQKGDKYEGMAPSQFIAEAGLG